MNLQAGETSHFSPTMMSCQKAPPLIPRKIREIGKAFLMLSTENTGRYKLMGVGKYLQHILDIYACLPLIAYNHQIFPFALSQVNLKERHAGLLSLGKCVFMSQVN